MLCLLFKVPPLFVGAGALVLCYLFHLDGKAMRQREEIAQNEDPRSWPGVLEVNRDAGITDGDHKCGRCRQTIRGVCCFDQGTGMPVHFGCADDGQQTRVSVQAPADDELQQVLHEFRLASEIGRSLYHCQLMVDRIFVLSSEEQRQRFQEGLLDLHGENGTNIRRLYHGTACASAKAIVQNGFEAPTTSGMFGKSIYFADVPQKSWQYSNNRYMFVCDVALGLPRTLNRADTSAERSYSDQYDSIIGIPSQGPGGLRVTEYAVFRPSQVLPRYLLWLREI